MDHKFLKYTKYAAIDSLKSAPFNFITDLILFVTEPATTILSPLIIVKIVDAAAQEGFSISGALWKWLFVLCLLKIIPQTVTLFSNSAMTSEVMGKCEYYFGRKMLAHTRKLRLEELEKNGTLDMFQRADSAYSNMHAVTEFFAGINTLLRAMIDVIGSILVVVSFSIWFLPGTMMGSIPHLLLSFAKEKEYSKVQIAQTPLQRKMLYLWNLFTRKETVKEMRTGGFGDYLYAKWSKANEQVVQERQAFFMRAMKKIWEFDCLQNLFYALNIAISVYLLVKGNISVAQFAASLGAFAVLQGNLNKIISLITITTRMYKYTEQYYDFFELETERDEKSGIEYTPFREKITFLNVHFRYPGAEKDALNGIDLEIGKGEHIVIVGENGSGKTTLSKLFTGVFTPGKGEVDYDGMNVQKFSRESLCRDISVVPQDFVHYQFTLRENIAISDMRFLQDDERLQKAIEEAELKELVQSIGGADAQLGREFDGHELSGGEWQRVAIARGIFKKDSGIVILDEPTSALDPLIEYEILTRFLNLIRDKTSVIISHRVGICRMADKIVVMKEGKVTECGTHEELLHAGGEYARLWSEQAKWYVDF